MSSAKIWLLFATDIFSNFVGNHLSIKASELQVYYLERRSYRLGMLIAKVKQHVSLTTDFLRQEFITEICFSKWLGTVPSLGIIYGDFNLIPMLRKEMTLYKRLK